MATTCHTRTTSDAVTTLRTLWVALCGGPQRSVGGRGTSLAVHELCGPAFRSERKWLTVTLPAELVEEVRARAKRGAISSWVAEAVADRLAREHLSEAIAEYEAEAGAVTDEDIATARKHTAWRPSARRRRHPAA